MCLLFAAASLFYAPYFLNVAPPLPALQIVPSLDPRSQPLAQELHSEEAQRLELHLVGGHEGQLVQPQRGRGDKGVRSEGGELGVVPAKSVRVCVGGLGEAREERDDTIEEEEGSWFSCFTIGTLFKV